MNVHTPRPLAYKWDDQNEALLRSFVQSGLPYSWIVGKMPADENGNIPTRFALIGKMHRSGVKGSSEIYEWNESRIELLRDMASNNSPSEIARTLSLDPAGKAANYHTVKRMAKKLNIELLAYEHNAGRKSSVRKAASKAKSKPPVKRIVWARGFHTGSKLRPFVCQPLPEEPQGRKESLRLSLMELRQDSCRFPLGTPGEDDFAYCGLPSEAGRSYCIQCCAIAYMPNPRSQAGRTAWLTRKRNEARRARSI